MEDAIGRLCDSWVAYAEETHKKASNEMEERMGWLK